jgi:hypothetical protein
MRTLTVTLLLGAALIATPALATDPACIAQAQADFATCKTNCKSDFIDAKAACRNISPGCLSQCNADRDSCIVAATASRDNCIALNGCDGIVGQFGDNGGRDICKAHVGCGGAGNPCGFNAQFISCLVPYEELAFVCRDNCRNLWQLGGGPGAVNACRATHHSCLLSCPQN